MTPSPYERAYACGNLGSPIEPSDFASPFDEMLQSILDQANTQCSSLREVTKERWRTRPFHITFADGRKMTARYKHGKSIDYIIVPVGAMETLYGAALGIMSEPSFCPRVGDVSLEGGIDRDLTAGFPPMSLLRKDYDEDMKLSVLWPNCRLRAIYAQHLAVNALHFMIMHEMGHLFGGHRDGGFLEGDDSAEVEFASSASGTAGRVPRLVEEIDADMFAMVNFSIVEMEQEHMRQLVVEMFPYRGLSMNEAAFVNIAITVGLLFRLAVSDSWALPAFSNQYPPPILRTLFSLSNLASCCINAELLKATDGPKLFNRSVVEIDRVWRKHKLPGHQLDPRRNWIRRIGFLSEAVHLQYEEHKPTLVEMARLNPIWHRGYW